MNERIERMKTLLERCIAAVGFKWTMLVEIAWDEDPQIHVDGNGVSLWIEPLDKSCYWLVDREVGYPGNRDEPPSSDLAEVAICTSDGELIRLIVGELAAAAVEHELEIIGEEEAGALDDGAKQWAGA